MILSGQTNDRLKSLGARLRAERLRRNETQQIFASRIGVSIPTYYKMEHGDPSVSIGQWVVALDILGHVEELDHFLAPTEDLFARYEQSKTPVRQRASRKDNK